MSDGSSPDDVLAKLAQLIDVANDGDFATVICGWLDPVTGELAVANPGHPKPVLIDEGSCHILDGDVGPPIGVGQQYQTAKTDFPRRHPRALHRRPDRTPR